MNGSDFLYRNSGFARAVRIAMRPFSALFGSLVGLRNYLYDSGRLHSAQANIPVLSVGNLSVGGTGKTPVTAWLATKLLRVGERPGIILRGYGGDEELVHRHLNPDVTVVANPDRLRGVIAAQASGATVAILDDAFQHRQIQRGWDIVLLSAERWKENMALLPAGDLREPLTSLDRADFVIVTRKSASRERAIAIEKALRARFRRLPIAIALLSPTALSDQQGNEIPMIVLQGKSVLAFSGVGDNSAFQSQMEDLVGNLRYRAFSDHHSFSARDIAELARESRDCDYVICTLKDAVKVWPSWPADAKPLWYVSQALILESGAGALDELLNRVAAVKRN